MSSEKIGCIMALVFAFIAGAIAAHVSSRHTDFEDSTWSGVVWAVIMLIMLVAGRYLL